MGPFSHADLQTFISMYGYWFVGTIIGIESMGIPLPGETTLVAAAIYAATAPDFSITGVVCAAIAGCIIGDNLGYIVGRIYGYPLLLRHGRRFNVTEDRVRLGQYLFIKHGSLIVFIGRFIAVVRILAAFMAGVNRMPWGRFLVANAIGGIIWSCLFGFGGYLFGELLLKMQHKYLPLVLLPAVIAFFAMIYAVHRFEKQLIIKAREALPGPIESYQA